MSEKREERGIENGRGNRGRENGWRKDGDRGIAWEEEECRVMKDRGGKSELERERRWEGHREVWVPVPRHTIANWTPLQAALTDAESYTLKVKKEEWTSLLYIAMESCIAT